jgi:hypothetical protein
MPEIVNRNTASDRTGVGHKTLSLRLRKWIAEGRLTRTEKLFRVGHPAEWAIDLDELVALLGKQRGAPPHESTGSNDARARQELERGMEELHARVAALEAAALRESPVTPTAPARVPAGQQLGGYAHSQRRREHAQRPTRDQSLRILVLSPACHTSPAV